MSVYDHIQNNLNKIQLSKAASLAEHRESCLAKVAATKQAAIRLGRWNRQGYKTIGRLAHLARQAKKVDPSFSVRNTPPGYRLAGAMNRLQYSPKSSAAYKGAMQELSRRPFQAKDVWSTDDLISTKSLRSNFDKLPKALGSYSQHVGGNRMWTVSDAYKSSRRSPDSWRLHRKIQQEQQIRDLLQADGLRQQSEAFRQLQEDRAMYDMMRQQNLRNRAAARQLVSYILG